MSIFTIPLLNGTNQVFNVKIEGKDCRIKIYESSNNLYMDFSIINESVAYGRICRNMLRINIDPKKILKSKVYFQDIEDNHDPLLSGLGVRYMLRVDDGVS